MFQKKKGRRSETREKSEKINENYRILRVLLTGEIGMPLLDSLYRIVDIQPRVYINMIQEDHSKIIPYPFSI